MMRMTPAVLVMVLAVARAELNEVKHVSRATAETSLDGCPPHVHWKDAPFPNALDPDKPTHVFWLKSLFTAKEASNLTRILMPVSFTTSTDSTDHQPSYEVYLLGAGKAAEATGEPEDEARLELARSIVLPRFEHCVAQFVRRKFGCASCVPCISLARRYLPTERTLVQPHRDALARVTVVVELQPAEPVPKSGGLFIKKSEDDKQNFVPMKAGDAFLHDYELLHGVQIACEGCVRLSLIVWFREDMDRCTAGGDVEAATQMYRRSALAGIAEGRYSWSRHAMQVNFAGQYEVRPNALPPSATDSDRVSVVRETLGWLEAAAKEQGHADSAVFLAELHLVGVPGALKPDAKTAARWRKRAKKLGGGSQLAPWDATRGAQLKHALRELKSRGEL